MTRTLPEVPSSNTTALRTEPARYGDDLDELTLFEDGRWTPAVDSARPPRTTKGDA